MAGRGVSTDYTFTPQSDGNVLPPAVLNVEVEGVRTADTHHVLEQPLGEEARASTGVVPVLLQTTVSPPVRRVRFSGPDTAQMAEVRPVQAALDQFATDLCQAPDNVRALVYETARQRVARGQPLSDPGALLVAGLSTLARSTLPEAAEWAAKLRPPSRSASGASAPLLASSSRDFEGRPLLVTYPQQGDIMNVIIAGESYKAYDHGHEVTMPNGRKLEGQCVVKALAAATDVHADDLWKALNEDSQRAEATLGDLGSLVSTYELQLRRLIHDFKHLRSHDLFLTRFLLPALFETYCLILVCSSASGQVAVQVVQGAHYDRNADGARTRLILAHDGHAYLLEPPARFTKGIGGEELTPAGGQALLNRFTSLGMIVQQYTHVSLGEVAVAPRTVPSTSLTPCDCCGEPLIRGTRAGRYPDASPSALTTDGQTALDGAKASQQVDEAAALPAVRRKHQFRRKHRVWKAAQTVHGRVPRPADWPTELTAETANGGGSKLRASAVSFTPPTSAAGGGESEPQPTGASGGRRAARAAASPGVRTWVTSLSMPSLLHNVQPIAPPLPLAIQRWVAETEVAGGLTQEALEAVYQNRSEDCRDHVRSVDDTRAFPTVPEVKAEAQDMLAAARTVYSGLDRPAIQTKEPEALRALAQGLKEVATRGDRLVAAAGGLRAATAAYRQAYLAAEGDLPISAGGLDTLQDLVRGPEFRVLQGLAKFGAPTLQAAEAPPTEFREPYPSAQAAVGDLVYTALKDAASARAFLTTGASRKSLADAGATLSSLGAVPKKEAAGGFTGKVRPVTDLRPMNKFLAEHLELQKLLSRLRAPQAVCPRVQKLMRAVVVLALRFPGVAIAGGKSDLSEAFKLVHVLLADVPSFGWKLPLNGLPGLEDLEVFQLLMVLPFGWDKSPGWFGLLAWVLAQAHASLGPEEPHLNGGDSFAGGLPWVDDYVFLTPLLAQRAHIAYEAYVGVATAGASAVAVNVEKDAIDGVPRLKFNPWGYVMDLSKLPEEGPLAGTLSGTREKVLKFLNQLTVLQDNVYTRRLKLKSLEEATGLAVWLAQTNSLLQALLPSFYCAYNSLGKEYVAPAGSAANVNQVWAELEDAVGLAKQLCLDYNTFTAAFTASVTRALSPLEQVALGVPRLVWQTDATGKDPLFEGGKKVVSPNGKPVYKQGVFGLALFGLKAWGAALVEDYETLLQGVVGLDRESHIVVGEMLPIVAAAMEHGEELRGFIVTCLVDNIAVVAALNKRASGHPFVRYLSLLLARLESLYGFQLVAYYINTKRNVLADDISRLFLELSAEELQAHVDSLHPGLVRREYGALLNFLLQEKQAKARTFATLKESTTAAAAEALAEGLERAARRAEWDWRDAARGSTTPSGKVMVKGGFVELFGGVGTMARAAVRVGLQCVAVVEAHKPSRALAVARLKEAGQAPLEYADIFEVGLLELNSAGTDLLLVGPAPPNVGLEPDALLVGLPSLVEHLQPLVVCVEVVPNGGRLGDSTTAKALIDALAKVGYRIHTPHTGRAADLDLPFELVDTAELGGGQQRHRAVLHFEPVCWESVTGPLAELRPAPGAWATLGQALKPLELVVESDYVGGRFVPHAPPEEDNAERPLLAGHFFTKDNGVGVGIGTEVSLVSREVDARRAEQSRTERWTVVAVQGRGRWVVERKTRRQSAGGERRVVGHSEVAEHHGRRLQVWHPRGAGATVRASWPASSAGDPHIPLVLETREGPPRARRLNVQELWQLQGLTAEDLKLFRKLNKPSCAARHKRGVRGEQELTAAGRATPIVLAEAVVARSAERLHTLQTKLRLAPSAGDAPRFERVEGLGQDGEGLVRRADGKVEAVPAALVLSYDPHQRGSVVTALGGPDPPPTHTSGGKHADSERLPVVAPGLDAASSKHVKISKRASRGKRADSERIPVVAPWWGAASSKQDQLSTRVSRGTRADSERLPAVRADS